MWFTKTVSKAALGALLVLLSYSGIASAQYVANNPLRWVDPTGLETELIVGGPNWYSHSAVRIDNLVYSGGRYPVPGQTTRSFGMIGPNVLTVQNTARYLEEARQWGAIGYVLNVSKEQEASIRAYYENLIGLAKQHPKREDWYILSDDYNFLTKNCATLSADALNKGLPWYYDLFVWGASTPVGLEWRIQEAPGLILRKRNY